ncbi:hypothetical protein QQF64_003373 [Cirrhinus molitorella]|uniref:Uncharacterized protein n=1 Tax=Cirrhinus molitorella TaxID=172907 RepID=A0ABR3ML41_9TELE
MRLLWCERAAPPLARQSPQCVFRRVSPESWLKYHNNGVPMLFPRPSHTQCSIMSGLPVPPLAFTAHATLDRNDHRQSYEVRKFTHGTARERAVVRPRALRETPITEFGMPPDPFFGAGPLYISDKHNAK